MFLVLSTKGSAIKEKTKEETNQNNFIPIKSSIIDTDTSMWKVNYLSYLNILSDRKEIIAEAYMDITKGATIFSWAFADGKQSVLAYFGDAIWVYCMALSHNEDYMIVAPSENDPTLLKLYSINEKKWLWEIQDLDHYKFVGFSEDDKKIIAFGNDAIYTINALNGDVLKESKAVHKEYPMSRNKITSAFLSASGKYLLIWQFQAKWALLDFFKKSANTTISVWNIEEEKIVASMLSPDISVESATFTADDKYVFLSGSDEKIKLWSLEENKIINQVSGKVVYITINYEKKYIATLISDKSYYVLGVKIWKYPEMTLLHTIEPYSKIFLNRNRNPFNFDKTGNYFAVEKDGRLYLYDTRTWEILWSVSTREKAD